MSAVPPPSSTSGVSTFSIRIAATLEQLALSRHTFTEWLKGIPMPRHRMADIVLAVGEAIANAIEHGGCLNPAQHVAVQGWVRDEILTVAVRDQGSWIYRPELPARPEQQRRGRGLQLIDVLANKVEISRSNWGTEVCLQFDVSNEIASVVVM